MIYLKTFLHQPPRSLPQHLSLAVSLVEFPGFEVDFPACGQRKWQQGLGRECEPDSLLTAELPSPFVIEILK